VGAARFWSILDVRNRWRAVAALALTVGIAGGVVIALVAGARRSSTAFERFREETLAADLDVAPPDGNPAKLAAVARLPQVTGSARSAFPFIVPAGSGLYPFLEFLAVAGLDDDDVANRVDRPRVVDGRLPAAGRADEMAVSEIFAREQDLAVGDRVEFDSYAADQVEALFSSGDAGPPAGPAVTLTVTGVVAFPDDLSESLGSFHPRAFLTPAFATAYAETMGVYPGGVRLRLERGEADVPAVSAEVRDIYNDDPELEISSARDVTDRIDDSIRVTVVALFVCAAFAALASAVAVAQALTRHHALSTDAVRRLRALGMRQRLRTAALTMSVAPVAIGGAVIAVVVAIALSPLMPVGVARKAEPDRGVSVDGRTLTIGTLAVAAVVLVLCLATAWRANRLASQPDRTAGATRPPPRVVGTLSQSPARSIGVRAALAPRAGSARSALAGMALAVAGVVAVTVFASSQDALSASPARYGSPWDARLAGFSGEAVGEQREALVADERIRDLGTLATSLTQLDGEDVNIYAFETLKGDAAPTVVEGRLPRDASEAVLGAATLRNAGVDIGDAIEFAGVDGPVRRRVVGRAVFPVVDDRSAIDRGVALTPEGIAPLAPADSLNLDLVVTWAPGVDERAANAELESRTGTEVFGPILPADVNNFDQVDTILLAVAAFLGALGLVALLHALVTTVRSRRRELAVLRALGFSRGQLGSVVSWQAVTVTAAGLVVGVPLGIVVGRAAWRAVANGIGVAPAPLTSAAAVVLVLLAAPLLAYVVAALPRRMARRTEPAVLLRAD
jgi:ABC-type lipoprotein release transport system permease subunit